LYVKHSGAFGKSVLFSKTGLERCRAAWQKPGSPAVRKGAGRCAKSRAPLAPRAALLAGRRVSLGGLSSGRFIGSL